MIAPSLHCELVQEILTGFIVNEVRKSGFSRVVIGLSGGVDSALSAYLGAKALGPENVLALLMPYKTSSPESREHAELAVKRLGIRSDVIDITPMVDAYFERFPESDQVRRGNKMARERMTILFDHSAYFKALVLGTSNKTELLLGYGTLYGDMASAINPLGDLYKTQVRQLARHMGIPEVIVRKAPSGDLWIGQTDEAELGFTYEEVDRVLYLMIDRRYEISEMVAAGFDEHFVRAVLAKVQTSQYKRRPPLIAKISARTIDRDFRYPRDWGK
ncbi:NAD synthetase [Candidatus Methylomirabilis lanthanidiphila]|uniref:NH(3)-dependent NAD(+) synthetase n=1 Tax=Candidatus Methylomirabilis lanthanidiphila TaxID=2211376 RepID=A0A564ZLI6_9BACT|nr:NAD+ synthase [Candidatus Methylomirabilis lanthanidiphila]VUZ86033.1 NAD synthetase [Candidatus Methylomirabilis lanthanidiphila]